MTVLPKSSLVSVRALRQDVSRARRGELLRNIVALLELASETCGDEVLNTYDSVMVKLAELVEPKIRAEIAARLAELRRAPGAIVHKLALDEIEVAQPLIIGSSILTDEDLSGIAEIRGNQHRKAIAVRPGIGERVNEILCLRGDDSVRRAVASNVTARLGHAAIQILLVQARRDNEMQMLLAEHPETVAEVLTQLLEFAGDEAKSVAARRLVSMRGATLQGRPMPVQQLFAGYDFEAAKENLRRRSHRRPGSIGLAARLARENDFASAAVALSSLSGFELGEVLRWFADCDAHFILVLAKAFNATERDFHALLDAGPIRFRLSASERASALDAFRALEVAAAILILTKRREQVAAA